MKKIYYVECNWDSEIGDNMGFWVNTKVMANFTKRKEAVRWLIERTRYIKEWCKKELKRLAENGETMTIDLYKCIVDDDFNIEVDNVWSYDYNYQLIDGRYLCGRY